MPFAISHMYNLECSIDSTGVPHKFRSSPSRFGEDTDRDALKIPHQQSPLYWRSPLYNLFLGSQLSAPQREEHFTLILALLMTLLPAFVGWVRNKNHAKTSSDFMEI